MKLDLYILTLEELGFLTEKRKHRKGFGLNAAQYEPSQIQYRGIPLACKTTQPIS